MRAARFDRESTLQRAIAASSQPRNPPSSTRGSHYHTIEVALPVIAVDLFRPLKVLHRPEQYPGFKRSKYRRCAECSSWDGERGAPVDVPWPCPTMVLIATTEQEAGVR